MASSCKKGARRLFDAARQSRERIPSDRCHPEGKVARGSMIVNSAHVCLPLQ